jgi:hypothetical protein
MPSSATASRPFANRRWRKAGSVQAFATTFAPRLRHPFFLGHPGRLVDEGGGLEPACLERGFDGIDAPFDGGGGRKARPGSDIS